MSPFPRDKAPDSTPALLSEGYTFISNRCRRYASDAFEARLMLRPVICTLGQDAARMFYAGDRFTRRRAMPLTTLTVLQDKGSVQLLDGGAHQHRKRMFMQLMTASSMQRLVDLMTERWDAYIARWQEMDRVVLHGEVEKILFESVCAWAGVPVHSSEVARRTRELAAMIEGAGSVGPRNWRGQLLRARSESWIRGVISRVRAGKLEAVYPSPLGAIAWHRDPEGELLDVKVAAVELLNLLRPTVAVARYVTFAALALHQHPAPRAKVRQGGDTYLEAFVHEVRRFYPFFPVVGGRVRQPFEWRGHRFEPGSWVLFDLYGTNHDARIWADPDTFRPERFETWSESAFDLVPQGAGEFETGHRCAGEWLTIALVKQAVRLLATTMTYDVPRQDLDIDLSRMPAIPKSRFVIQHVRRQRAEARPQVARPAESRSPAGR